MENWPKIEFLFAFKFNTSPVDLDKLEFYRVEDMIEQYQEYIEEEENRHKKQQEEYEKKYKTQAAPSSNDFMKNLPNYGGFKLPNYNFPKMG